MSFKEKNMKRGKRKKRKCEGKRRKKGVIEARVK
jgi:hypothetical protein